MFSKIVKTKAGIDFWISYYDGNYCIIMLDKYFCKTQLRYFTSLEKAISYVHALDTV